MARPLIPVFAITLPLLWLGLAEGYGHWAATHWLFTYEGGVIKRGLPGSLLSLALPQISAEAMTAHQRSIAYITCLTFALLVVSVLPTRGRPLATLSLCAVLLTAPGTLQQVLYDLGRFDALGLILLCAATHATLRWRAEPAFAACLICATLAILVHEAFAIWVAPLAFSLWIWRHGPSPRTLIPAIGAAIVLISLTTLIAHQNYAAQMPFDTSLAQLQERAEFSISEGSLRVQYRDLSANLTYTFAKAWGPERWLGLGSAALLLGAWFLVILSLPAPPRGRPIAALALSLLPLGLMLLGHDHGRWCAMVNASLALILIAMVRESPNLLTQMTLRQITALSLLATAQLATGPFGIDEVFPSPLIPLPS